MYYSTPSKANKGKLSALGRGRFVLSETPSRNPADSRLKYTQL